MNIKKTIITLLSLLTLVSLSSCKVDKDNILNGYNKVVETGGKLELTSDFKLKGEKTKGSDDLRGTYTVYYKNFTGEECLFGATSIETNTDIKIKADISSKDGDAKIILSTADNDEEIILENSGSIDESYHLSAGRNYIIIKCDDFTGSVSIEVE